jgi:hypothetical protein
MDRSGRWRLPSPGAPSCLRWLGTGVATGLCGALVSLNGSPGGGAATALAVGGCIVLITAGSPTTTALLWTTDVSKYAACDRLQRLAAHRLKRLSTPLQ